MTRLVILFLTTCAFILGVLPAFANATDSSTLKISVVHEGRMTFEGSVLSGNRANISMADIRRKQAVNLGTLNLKSVENYDVAFKSANGFRLKGVSGTLAEYNIKYDGQNIVLKTNVLSSTRLNSYESKTGVYEDTLTVVITAP